jgi:YkoY family integral membrane protein
MITTILVFLNILLIEIILSIDNASVLAVIVNKQLNNDADRGKALKYGILGAYIFRGISLLFVSYIIYNPSIGAWFKIIGGIYLCYLFYTHLTPAQDSVEEGNVGFIQKMCSFLKINKFWTTVIMVEFLDMVFSIDNLVACVSLSPNIYIVCGAVFLGILGMRFVAKYFSSLLLQFPSLENSAFYVILLLGVKMFVAGIYDFMPASKIHFLLNSHNTDIIFSAITLLVFLLPIIKLKLLK